MNKKLEIGDEIVIYPEKGLCYTSLETKNGYKNQAFNSSNFPKTLTAVFIGREKGKDGKWYEKYTLKTIPKELKGFCLKGKRGFLNLIEELDAIAQILQGTAEDGRKILYSRSINIEDVNEILGVVVDYKNKRIYQKNNPSQDINEEGNQLEFTAYCYSIWYLKISEKRKEIVQLLNGKYHLASRSVLVDSLCARLCEGSVNGGYVDMLKYLFDSDGYEYYVGSAVLPVFYLESDVQDEIIEEQQEEKVLT